MTDLLGPANAVNSVTTQPSDSRVFGATDTYFKPCTSTAAQDGTAIQAVWLNAILNQLRRAIRGMGIAVDNTSNDLLLQAIQAATPPYAVDTGTASALIVNVNLPGFALNAGTRIRVKLAQTVVGATTMVLSNGATPYGTLNVTRADGTTINPYDVVAGEVADLTYDGTQFQVSKGLLGGTGDLQWNLASTSKSGWVPLNGLTIGSAASGATLRANADARELYVFCYLNYSNTLCPVSGGRGGSNRAAALADFAANKTLQVPDSRCRSLVGVDAMAGASATGRLAGALIAAGNASTPGSSGGEAAHVDTLAETALHDHAASATSTSAVVDPFHLHASNIYQRNSNFQSGSGITGVTDVFNTGSNAGPTTSAATGISVNTATTVSIGTNGGSAAHNVMNPFLTGVLFARL